MLDSQVTLIGNVVAEPELRFAASGVPRALLRVATNSRFYDRTAGEWREHPPVFLGVVCWRSLAANVSASVRKGDRVVVVGRLRQRSYDSDGVRHTLYEVDAETVAADLSRCEVSIRKVARSLTAPGSGEPSHGDPAEEAAGDPAEEADADLAEDPDELVTATGPGGLAGAEEAAAYWAPGAAP